MHLQTVLIYYAAMSVISFFLYGIDKNRAQTGRWRIRESVLLGFSLLGGAVGALLGMKVWRHKTLHKTFRFGIPAILILQILIPLGLWVYFRMR